MKNFNYLIMLMIITTAQVNAKSQNTLEENPLASNIDYTVHIQKTKLQRQNTTIEFTPDQAFGGTQAQGNYNHKKKTAKIVNGDIIYHFKLIKELPNPEQPYNKHQNLVRCGSFTNRINRGMPVTQYLFGQLTEE